MEFRWNLYESGTTKLLPPPKKAETEGVYFGKGVLAVNLDDAARVFLPEISYTGS